MERIRPVSDLRNRFTEISADVHESGEPIFLTRNGHPDMVVMSMDSFEVLEFSSEVYTKLREAEREAAETSTRFSADDVIASLRSTIDLSSPGAAVV